MPAKNNIMWQVKVNQNTSYAFNIVIFYSTSAVAVTLRLCVDILHSRGHLTSHIFSLPNTRWVWSKSDERAITVLSVTPPMMSMSQHKRFWWRCLIPSCLKHMREPLSYIVISNWRLFFLSRQMKKRKMFLLGLWSSTAAGESFHVFVASKLLHWWMIYHFSKVCMLSEGHVGC